MLNMVGIGAFDNETKTETRMLCCSSAYINNEFFFRRGSFFFFLRVLSTRFNNKKGGGKDCVLVICILLSCALVAFLRIANYKFNVFFTLNWHIFLDRNVKKNCDWII